MRWSNPIGNWRGSASHRYFAAIAAVAILALLQYAVQPLLRQNAQLGLLIVAVMFSALYGGGGPALLATGLSILIGTYFLLDPKLAFVVARSQDKALLIFFGFLGVCMSLMGALLRNARRTAYELMNSLEEREKTMRALLESTMQAVVGIDPQGKIRLANKAVFDVFGYRSEELIGQPAGILIAASAHGGNAVAFMEYCITSSMKGQELWGKRKDGTTFPIEASFSMAETRTGALAVSYIADITARKQAAEKLLQAAQHDPLTDLPNRALIYELGAHLLASADRGHNQAAVLFFDLDRFKPINDTYGHLTGDKMLQEVASRLRHTVRASDLVGRLGGDEFIAVLPDIREPADVLQAASILLKRLGEPYRIDSLELRTSPSIGISIYPDDGRDLDTLIRHADAAMYYAKSQGRNTFQFFTQEINKHAERTLAIEQRMRQSMEREDFELWYQPIIDTQTRRVVGAEALIRWPQENSQTLLPCEFIAVAEASGLIHPIGDWVLRKACLQHQKWRGLGLPPLRISINVSPLQFRSREFQARVRGLIEEAGVNPACLELEVTESTVMKQVEEASRTLAGLKELGVRVALDDFGTGYSSLSHLSNLPIDKLKVDQSFIRHIDTDARSLAITETVIMLARKLDVEVVAEGIESEAALELLRQRGCQLGQGYLISAPLQEAEFTDWYRRFGGWEARH